VGLIEARYRKADSYSTGMKQRLKLASALVHDPRLLILDEPTNGMDPRGRDEMLAMARDLAHAKGMSLLFSSHLLPDVEAVCDHIMVMGAGQLLASGRIDDLKRHEGRQLMVRTKTGQDEFSRALQARGLAVEPKDDGLLVSLHEGDGPEYLWRLASETGVQIRSLLPRRSTLEEVFLSALAGAAKPNAPNSQEVGAA